MADSPRIEELRRRVQVDPASIAFAALAEEYRKAGRFEEAIATCTAGLQRHPAYLSAHVTLGRALIEVGRFEEAREELEHVLRLAPENLAAIRGLAEIHHRRGELPESAEHFHHPPAAVAPSHGPTPERARRSADTAPPAGQAGSGAPAVSGPPAAQPQPLAVSRMAPAPDPSLEPLEKLLAAIVEARGDRHPARR